jgi:hypothetical protein
VRLLTKADGISRRPFLFEAFFHSSDHRVGLGRHRSDGLQARPHGLEFVPMMFADSARGGRKSEEIGARSAEIRQLSCGMYSPEDVA